MSTGRTNDDHPLGDATTSSVPAELEPDRDLPDESDSSYDEASLQSSAASLASSVLQYRHENGRRYHGYKSGSYILPNDEIEQDRLDLQHSLLDMTFGGKLHICPAGEEGSLGRVLDIGTGTGIWAMDYAEEHPETEVIGVDLSPIQPTFVPPNVSFFVDDVESEWVYHKKFDLVYTRMMTGSLKDWATFTKRAFDKTKPGGWIEIVDIAYIASDDGTLPADSALQRWTELTAEAAEKLGHPMDAHKHHAENLQNAGFVDVKKALFKWPTNQWPKDPHHKELGRWTNENMGGGLQGITMALLTRGLGWSAQEVEVLIANVRSDIRNRAYHAYWPIIVFYAQKPGVANP